MMSHEEPGMMQAVEVRTEGPRRLLRTLLIGAQRVRTRREALARLAESTGLPIRLSVPVVTVITVPVGSLVAAVGTIGITRAAVVTAVRRIRAISAT